jgi:hypothetical protein
MALDNPKAFHDAPPAGFSGVFDWDFLAPAFPVPEKGAGLTDIDAAKERNRHFLGVEAKRSWDVPLPDGQRIAFENLVKEKWVLIFLGTKTPAEIRKFQVWLPYYEGVLKIEIEGDQHAVVKAAAAWWEYADNKISMADFALIVLRMAGASVVVNPLKRRSWRRWIVEE